MKDNKSRLFSSDRRLSDLITAHPSLLTLMTRLGISLGFGDRSIADVCEESGVDTDFFLLICNVYTFNNYVPSTAAILGTDMMGLVPYLEKSHSYYVDKRLPHIECHLDAIAQNLKGRIGQVFISFFQEYKAEVEEHFAHEERDVFPHISALMSGERDTTYSIDKFIATHSDIEGKLDDLLNIVFKYLPPQVDDDNVMDVVDDILRLREDLKKHTFIEEKIMVPLVKHLEKAIMP
ncbi:MAG: hemerythrin domain-containing protein [Muribaculaceae bacterium]|nr:hemerythrin domain-containing protein [Muribaculaceae bacterium]